MKHEHYDEPSGLLTISPADTSTTTANFATHAEHNPHLAAWGLLPGAAKWDIVKAAAANGWYLVSVQPVVAFGYRNVEQTLTFSRDTDSPALVDGDAIQEALR